MSRELDFEGALSVLHGFIGDEIQVFIGVRQRRAPTVILHGVLHGGTDSWDQMTSRSDDEVIAFAVGDSDHAQVFAVDRAGFTSADQDGVDDLGIVLDPVVISIMRQKT